MRPCIEPIDPIDENTNQSPLECLRAWASQRPDAVAIARLDANRSYADLFEGIRRAAAWLYHQGVRQNDTVATLFDLRPEETLLQIELAYGVGWLGAVLLPLYPGTAIVQVGPVLQRFCADWLLASDALADLPGQEETPALTNGKHLQVTTVASYARAVHTGEPGTPVAPSVPMQLQRPERGFVYEFSSGTSGTPKVVLQSNANYLLAARVSGRAQGWQNNDVHMGAMRWPHKLGLRAVFRAHCMGAAWLDENFPLTRSQLNHLIAQAGLTSVTSTPVQVRMLLASAVANEQLHPLRLLSNSGAAMTPDEVKSVRTQITPNFYTVYGGTETGIVALGHPDDLPDAPMRVVPGVELLAVDAQGQSVLGRQAGRLRIRSAWICEGYARHEAASAQSFQDGWYLSNDIGEVSQGGLRLGARLDDMINFGGGKVDPLPIEAVLRQHPDVADAAVVAMADVWEGQLPVAFVVARQGLSMDALRQHVDRHLDAGQRPAFFVLARALPYNADGKIRRDELRKTADVLRSRVQMPSDRAALP